MHFNHNHRRSGHLWQNRFYSCPLGPSRLATALAYVDLNPFRARMVNEAQQYVWSSAASHLSGHDRHELLDTWEWNERGLRAGWAETLSAGSTEEQEQALRAATYSGTPFGRDVFIDRLEKTFDRRLRPGSPGRSQKHSPREPPPRCLVRNSQRAGAVARTKPKRAATKRINANADCATFCA